MLKHILKNHNIILGSQSPRRQMLLRGLDIPFTIDVRDVEEDYPSHLQSYEIALYLADLKAKAYENDLDERTIVITADTIVWINGKALTKPKDFNDGVDILNTLSGNMHEVVTGVCLKSKNKTVTFYALTKVYFKHLSTQEIEYYLNTYKPYDKAGAYGAQEWIGYVAIERIEGSYFNVMGLPTRLLYEELVKFIS